MSTIPTIPTPSGKTIIVAVSIVLSVIAASVGAYYLVKWIKAHKKPPILNNDGDTPEKVFEEAKDVHKNYTVVTHERPYKLNDKGNTIQKLLWNELKPHTYTSDESVLSALGQLKTVGDLAAITFIFDAFSKKWGRGDSLMVAISRGMSDTNGQRAVNLLNSLPKTI